MDLEDSSQEMFRWQTPFYCTPLNDDVDPATVVSSLDDILVDIELLELNWVPEQLQAAAAPHPQPVSSPVSRSIGIRTTPVVNSATLAPASICNPLTVNTILSCVQTGAIGFEIPAPTSPVSSAPNTPPVLRPKRARGSGPAKSKSSTRKAKKCPAVSRLDATEPKSEVAEHIIRERQRRDDMAAKYSILESLLPPAPKRERAVVVEDAISFVEALQQQRAQRLKRRADLKLVASCKQSPWAKKTRSLAPLHEPSETVVNPSACIVKKQRSATATCKSDSPFATSSDAVVVQADTVIVKTSRAAGPTASAINAVKVHLAGEEIVLEIVWSQPRPNFQSALLQAVESLGFDVTKCCTFRVGNGNFLCVITCAKSQVLSQRSEISEIRSSSTMISRVLTNMLTQS